VLSGGKSDRITDQMLEKILTTLTNASDNEDNRSASVKDSGGKRRENSVKIRIDRSSETAHFNIYSTFYPFLIPFLSYRNGPR
jgi:hypothetical protein